MKSGSVRYHSGLKAEDIVGRHYEANGWRIADRRWRGSGGELDLVVQEGERLVFVEVKKARDFARAAERVSRRQMQRIYATASEYLGNLPDGQMTDVRFDVALVDGVGRVQVVENAIGF
ncbi:putative endonuclease [Aliiruegeria haliotis]|uniref:UPF0102 protein CLV78_102733 n=1 Tax=Aliiruegeria haliotis TaxID=1280846 RepID=A0A2T0RWX3_9RHOB|nr:YraN family protein [Aliiruegeria haliotis]PRY25553.1 putative endonuclease [Aliiruegeria haliotis]